MPARPGTKPIPEIPGKAQRWGVRTQGLPGAGFSALEIILRRGWFPGNAGVEIGNAFPCRNCPRTHWLRCRVAGKVTRRHAEMGRPGQSRAMKKADRRLGQPGTSNAEGESLPALPPGVLHCACMTPRSDLERLRITGWLEPQLSCDGGAPATACAPRASPPSRPPAWCRLRRQRSRRPPAPGSSAPSGRPWEPWPR